MCKQQRISACFLDALNHTVRPHPDLRKSLAARISIYERMPIWPLSANLRRSSTLIASIVPFHEVRVVLHGLRETRELRRAASPDQGTAQYGGELHALQLRFQGLSLAFACLGEWNIAASRMLATV